MGKRKSSNKLKKEVIKRGRKKGELPQRVILYNRHNCMFYTTIKDGDKVIGRDYTVHEEKVKDLQTKFKRSRDTQTTKLLKAIKNTKFKEDVFKALPNLFDYEKTIDLISYPAGLFENTDNKISIVPDKTKMLLQLDKIVSEAGDYLSSIGRPDFDTWIDSEYSKLVTEDIPIGRTEDQDPKKVQLKQLLQFKLF